VIIYGYVLLHQVTNSFVMSCISDELWIVTYLMESCFLAMKFVNFYTILVYTMGMQIMYIAICTSPYKDLNLLQINCMFKPYKLYTS
jgi:hypothetical protein